MEHSNDAVKTAFDLQVDGKHGPGRPMMTWKQLTERDRREWKLSAIVRRDKVTWRSGVRSAMRAASQLPGRGPTDVDVAPVVTTGPLWGSFLSLRRKQTLVIFLSETRRPKHSKIV